MGPPLSLLHQSKKFIFDSSASSFIGDLVRRAQFDILKQHEWARPPFTNTWVEIDHDAYWRLGLKADDQRPLLDPYTDEPVDNQVGFLISNSTVWLFWHADAEARATLPPHRPDRYGGQDTGAGPFQYQLHTPISAAEELEMASFFGIDRTLYRKALIGGVITSGQWTSDDWWRSTLPKSCAPIRCSSIRRLRTCSTRWMRRPASKRWRQGRVILKLLIISLLMLTRPKKVFTTEEVGPKRMLWRGHNKVRRGHSIVTMKLDREKAAKRIIKHIQTAVHRQMHDVRGHWAQTRKTGTCEHSSAAYRYQPLLLPPLPSQAVVEEGPHSGPCRAWR